MIDLITLVETNLSEIAIASIIKRSNLQSNSNAGKDFYDNINTKNLSQHQGIYIKIDTNKSLKIEGSLHKYSNEISGKERSNYNLFSMVEAKQTITHLLEKKGISMERLKVYNYEIGLNLNVLKDCRAYLDKMKSIGAMGSEKQLYVNPKYNNERVKTTIFSKHTRKYFKAYDKVFESMDRKRKIIPEENILRIETVNKRLDNCYVIDFFKQNNLMKLLESFFRDWRTLQFEQDIITPKGTGRARHQLCLDIINTGKESVLIQAKNRHKNGSLSDWEYRNIKEFISNEWETIKNSITFIQSDEEKEFRQLIKVNYSILKNDEINRKNDEIN